VINATPVALFLYYYAKLEVENHEKISNDMLCKAPARKPGALSSWKWLPSDERWRQLSSNHQRSRPPSIDEAD
jgi:hypothetical protein